MGAIGGYYGSKLAYSGQEVHFLLHSDYQFVKECGMQVDSCDGSFHLDHVNVYQYAEDMPKCDVVIVGLKTTNNHLLPSLLTPLLHEHTVVDEAFVEKMIETTDAMTPYSPSMKLDFDFHRPMEIHYLYTRPIEIARAAGYRMRKLEMLEAELRFLSE